MLVIVEVGSQVHVGPLFCSVYVYLKVSITESFLWKAMGHFLKRGEELLKSQVRVPCEVGLASAKLNIILCIQEEVWRIYVEAHDTFNQLGQVKNISTTANKEN